MGYYPIFVEMTARPCVVVGGVGDGLRRLIAQGKREQAKALLMDRPR